MKLVILDRDGVINQDSDSFIKSPGEWVALPGSLEAIARLSQAGWKVVVASNQSGLARGLFSMQTLNAINAKMRYDVAQAGGHIDSIFICAHGPDDGCECRKPKPGMFLDIARRYDTELNDVPAVGDSLRDLQACAAAGCAPWLVLTGKGQKTWDNGNLPAGTLVGKSLAAIVDIWLGS
ncbi:MAG: D-glycero-beta-D-manno-heptose 1,7-bisphosphate 7-phosphatase [Burkholderiaceae bacterium]|nr:MAG: D-glycero-beta-D-manno-heptose 1,7-bisphosphate 7-phosphatase [Burkholderiaceae bacterium]TAM07137.1 MAG: D-glycero-beta-D-manno-heptose 1,7-bisphosphate 7-phosphatase [Pusillimonas sp.]